MIIIVVIIDHNITVEIITSLSLLLSLFSHEMLLFLLNKVVNISAFLMNINAMSMIMIIMTTYNDNQHYHYNYYFN